MFSIKQCLHGSAPTAHFTLMSFVIIGSNYISEKVHGNRMIVRASFFRCSM